MKTEIDAQAAVAAGAGGFDAMSFKAGLKQPNVLQMTVMTMMIQRRRCQRVRRRQGD